MTHFAAISKIIANPEPFIAQLMAKATDVGLDGYDVDYEPQENEKVSAPVAMAEQACEVLSALFFFFLICCLCCST